MHKKQSVIISSVSDCREKNGIVTFMEILARHASLFSEHGMQLTFSNYVDLKINLKSPIPESASPLSPTSTVSSPNFITIVKRRTKALIVTHPLPSFLLFLGTLGARGLVTALKARRHDEPGCVHFYQDFFVALFGSFLHHKAARRVIILHSGDDALSQLFAHFTGMIDTRYERLVRRWFDWTLRRQQVIVTLSEKYAEDLRRRYASQIIRCIYNTSPFNGIRATADLAQKAKDRIKLVAVGTLQFRKGFDLLIEAIASMPYSEREKLDVTIVGGGPSHTELAELINQYQLGHIVTLTGESDDVASFLALSDAYILTSRDEGLPISLIEACSYSLPIISTAVGSIPELFDKSSCKLVEPTKSSIAEALMSLCGGELDLDNLSLQSRRLFESKLSLEKFLDSYVSLLAGKC
jgi:glycosyltransferase involved in cell wall biosynthesis